MNTIRILFSGIENLDGTTAIELVETFGLEKYAGVKVGQAGKFYTGDFLSKIHKEYTLEALQNFTGLLVWFGLHRIRFRFDRKRGGTNDDSIDYQLHMLQDKGYISFPVIRR
jgi:hypothetical protein